MLYEKFKFIVDFTKNQVNLLYSNEHKDYDKRLNEY